MSLRGLAERHLALTIEDGAGGFGWPITLTSPAGVATAMTGQSVDISAVIDPDTGQLISGRQASVALRIASIPPAVVTAEGLPRNVPDDTSKPWRVTFDDINGVTHEFKVKASLPDRTIGLTVLTLEAYVP